MNLETVAGNFTFLTKSMKVSVSRYKEVLRICVDLIGKKLTLKK